ncbi:MAG: hypothetical protein GQ540_08530 [Lutibacter sp.]|uniref:beta strand repeat-containing protein n=1 Tax=Lutibacter sp. TaxID=1925666 RepID=UPI0019DD712D|nr:hypothetical protein [Lutibacter sp.]NOR28558.1 hypothetical protein [Lutibacter sp.]
MKTKIIGFVLFLVVQYNVLGQAAASWNYDTQTGTLGTTYDWIDCSGGTNIVSGDDSQATISWPFDFSFYDNNYTTSNNLSVATNGFIRLDGNGSTDYNLASNFTLSSNSLELGQIIGLGVYDGKVGDNGGWIRSLVTGTAPNRIFTIEYNTIEIDYNDRKYADVQASFYESSNKIILKLGVDNVTKSGADIGLHSGVNTFYNKWQEVVSGTNNTWIEYTPGTTGLPPTNDSPLASWNYELKTGVVGTTYNWIDCSAGLAIVSGDDNQGFINWPYDFNFYDNTYNTSNVLSLATNGFIRLDGSAPTDYTIAEAYNLTDTSINLGQIIAMGVSDGNVADAGSWTRSLVTGTAPNRIFTIEYNNFEINYNANKYADVQVSFYESSHKIVLKLGADNVTTSSADLGIHSGVNTFFNKWQEVANGTNNTWIEYTPPFVEVNATIGTLTTFYPTLKDAFDKINDGTHQGTITIKIKENTTEYSSAILNASGTGSSNYSSVNIYPTKTGLSISGNLATPLIDLNGADNVTINGSVNEIGSAIDLSFINTSIANTAGTSTIRFINGATNNTIKNSTIKGSETDTASGVLFFSTTTAGSGNNTNTINNNNITNAADANRPVNAIYSLGTIGKVNSGNNISNNNIYDFLNHSTASKGISLSSNTTEWTIDGNSFYETTSFTPTGTVAYDVIRIENTSGNGFIVSNNHIGGSALQCGGTAWTKTNSTNNLFRAIYLDVGTTVASSLQNNTIQNFNWSNSGIANWIGIKVVDGAINIGTTTGNTIGATTGTNSISVTGGTNGQTIYAFRIKSTGELNCNNNSIGSITGLTTSSFSTHIYGIELSGSGITNIVNNTIGSTSTASSIYASSASTANQQKVYGIYSSSTGTTSIHRNTISNLKNNTSNTAVGTSGLINGIYVQSGTNTVTENTVSAISIANANTSISRPSAVGVYLSTETSVQSISDNLIFNISNTYSSFTGNVVGLYFSNLAGSNVGDVNANFIHSISVDAASTGATIYGIYESTDQITYSNNIISLGGSTSTTLYGMFDVGVSGKTVDLFFNSIYLSGTNSSSEKSYALRYNTNSNTRDLRNNILFNARNGGSGSHYAIYYNTTGGTFTADYNDYYANGTGGVIGYFGGDQNTLALLQTATSQDVNSLNTDPNFSIAGGTNSSDYITTAAIPGIAIPGITTDYDGISRANPPKMGALEFSLGFIWQGDTSTDFATAANWQNGAIPPNGADISFAATPTNDCVLDSNRTLNSITNTSTKKFVVNGKQFTLTGSIVEATTNQIDASSTSSIVIFEGTTAQSIPSGAFVSDTFDGLTLNNSSGLTLNGDLIVQTALALTNGAFTIGSNTLSINGSITTTTSGTLIGGSTSNISIGGSGASTNLPAITLNNLTLNRSNGIRLEGNVSVEGTLILTSGTLTVGATTLTILGNAPTRTSGNIDSSNIEASLVFTNSSAILLPALVFSGNVNNLTINGAGITTSDDLTVNGILNLQSANPSSIKGSLDMDTFTLNMGISSTTIGEGDVIGIVKRAHTFIGNVEYTFGNKNTSIVFENVTGGIKPVWVSCKIAIGTAPSWRTEAINRIYSFAQDGTGTDRTVTRLHYLDSELHGAETDESKLVFWDAYPGPSFTNTFPRSKSNNNTTNNWVELTGMAIDFIATSTVLDVKQWGLSYSNVTKKTWTGNGSISFVGDWSLPGNWDGGVPLATEDVLIPAILPIDTNGYPTRNLNSGSVPAVAKTIEIEPGASITVDNYDITVSGDVGAWINNGLFYPGTGKVIFNHGVPAEIVTIAGITDFYNIEVGPNTTFQPVSGNTLRIAGAGTADVTSFVDFSLINNTVEWNGTNQTIVNPNGIGGDSGYYKLILSGSGIKTMPTTAMTIADEFILTGNLTATAQAPLTIGNELEILNEATFTTGAFNHSVGGHFDVGGHLTAGNFIATAGTTITLNGTAVQNIYGDAAINFENLIINNSNSVNIFKDIVVNDVLTLTNGNLNVGNTTLTINGGLAKTAGFLNVNSLSSLTFGGTAALTLPSSLFLTTPSINNLIINRTGGVITSSDFTINGILDLQSANPSTIIGGFDTGSYILNMGATATTIGIGDVTGKIRRTTILPNIEYTFGNEFTSVTFPNIGTLPTEITLKATIGTVPTWKTDGIKRVYDISQIGGSGTRAVIKSHYLDSELNGLDEINVSFFSYVIPTTELLDRGLTEINITDNWITLSNADFGNLPGSFGVIEHSFGVSDTDIITWEGSVSTDWYDSANWNPAFAPGATKHVIIPDATSTTYDPIITASTNSSILSLVIQTAGILNAGAISQLTILASSGAWKNDGDFNASTGKVIFNNGVASEIVTIAGITDFYNIEVGANTTLQPVPGNILRIAGVGIADVTSIVDFSSINNTVEWNGGNQTIVNPNGIGGNSGYFNLILSGSGTKTMPNTALTIQGDFTTSGTANITAAEVLVISGNTLIGNGSTFATGNFNHLLAGNFENNGAFTSTSSGIITFNGAIAQTILGTSTTSFDNLTIDNVLDVIQASNINVNNVLLLNGGNLIVGNATLGINGTISNPSGNIDVSAVSNLNFGGTAALTLNNNLFYTEPSINDLTINRSGGVTLGNQNMSIGGALALTSGTFTLLANTLTLSGSSPTKTSGNINASDNNAEMIFTNTSAITLPTDLFSGNVTNFTVNGIGGVISNGNIAITGILNLESGNPSTTKGSLEIASTYELNMGADATTVGIGDVTGIVKREHVFADGIEYSFGNQFTSLNFLNVSGGIKPTWVKCKITIGAAPTWRSEAIQRHYSFAQSGGTDRMIVKLHYLDSELHDAETDESQLVYWDAYDPAFGVNNFISFYPRNLNGVDVNNNWVQLTGPAINYIATSNLLDVKQWGLSYTNVAVHTWTGNGSPSYDGDWSLPGNWNGGVPQADNAIQIPHPDDLPDDNNGDLNPYANLLPIIAPSEVKSVEIVAGATLSATDYDITVYGDTNAWVNNGTFTAGTATVIFANGNLANTVSIAGTTNFYNLTINDKTWLQPATGSVIGIENGLSFASGSALDFTSNNNTIDYNGTNQTVINPNGGTTGYYNLSLSGNGIKTLPSTSFQIIGNLALLESAITTTSNDLTIGANLNLSNTSKCTIAAGKTLTVNGTITNLVGNAGFVLESSKSGTASLIHNTNNVPATVERYISGDAEDWHFLSTPISNQTIAGSSWEPTGTYGNGTGYDLYVWDEPTPCWVYYKNDGGVLPDDPENPDWPAAHPLADFVTGRGYLYAVQALNPTNEFLGNLNNGNVSYSLTANSTADPLITGFNLIGNPYPSSIDWKASSGWTRSNLLDSGGGYDMWIWNPAANNYGVFNSADLVGTNDVTQYIAPMQGFFVRAASNANISMSNDIRLHTGASNWMKSSNIKNKISNLKVQIASNSGFGFDEVLLQFGHTSNKSGAAKLFSTTETAPSTYFKVGNEELSVRYLTDTIENSLVPLMFKPGSNENYTLTIDVDFSDFDYVLLEDQKTKIFHDLLENPAYQFKGSQDDDANRFVLHFTPKENNTEEDLSALIYYDGNDIIVDLTLVPEQTEVVIYDMLGRRVLNQNLEGQTVHHLLVNSKSQLFIVVAKSVNKSVRKKVLVY